MKRNPHVRSVESTTPPALRAALDAQNWPEALRIAVKFPVLGKQKDSITRAHEALRRPEFYRSIGKDPDVLVAEGVAALKERYAA